MDWRRRNKSWKANNQPGEQDTAADANEEEEGDGDDDDVDNDDDDSGGDCDDVDRGGGEERSSEEVVGERSGSVDGSGSDTNSTDTRRYSPNQREEER